MRAMRILPFSPDMNISDTAIPKSTVITSTGIRLEDWATGDHNGYTKDGYSLNLCRLNLEFYYAPDVSKPVVSFVLGAMLPILQPSSRTADRGELPSMADKVFAAYIARCHKNFPRAIRTFWESNEDFENYISEYFTRAMSTKLNKCERCLESDVIHTSNTLNMKVLFDPHSCSNVEIDIMMPHEYTSHFDQSRSCDTSSKINRVVFDRVHALFENGDSFGLDSGETRLSYGTKKEFDDFVGLLHAFFTYVFESIESDLNDELIYNSLVEMQYGKRYKYVSIQEKIAECMARSWILFLTLFATDSQDGRLTPTSNHVWGTTTQYKSGDASENSQHALTIFLGVPTVAEASMDDKVNEMSLRKFILLHYESAANKAHNAQKAKEHSNKKVSPAVND